MSLTRRTRCLNPIQGANIVALATTQKLSARIRMAVCLASVGLLSACIGGDAEGRLKSAPAWQQDDNAVMAPGHMALDDA